MSDMSHAIGCAIVWIATKIDGWLIRHSESYRIRRYYQDLDRLRITGDHVWNKNVLEVLNVYYGYDKQTTNATDTD